ncbi:MAG: hypothetical protein RLZZ591_554 [Pseudomonadota bacterium]|jgi:exodeoxyribonuclease VII small subunit
MPKASAKPVDPPIASSFEAAQDELDRLVSRMEAGDLPLDQLLSAYQRGAQLLQFCRDRLEAVDQQIKLLDAGNLKNWSPE